MQLFIYCLLSTDLLSLVSTTEGGLLGGLSGLTVVPGSHPHNVAVDGAGHAILQLDVDFGELVVCLRERMRKGMKNAGWSEEGDNV